VKSGQPTAILTDFYERQLREEPEAVRRMIEDELVTDTGHRESMSLEKARSKLERAGVLPDSLERLVQGRLLRIEDRLDRKRIEVAHDILTRVIQKSRMVRELEDAKRRAEAGRQRAEKRQRLAEVRKRRALFTLVVGFVIAAIVCYAFYRQAENEKALTAKIREQAEKESQQLKEARRRGQELLDIAEGRLKQENDPRKDVLALYYLSRALRFDRENGAAISLTWELLSKRAWCPALSPILQVSSESALLCASWDPNGNLIAISKDGQFLRWDGTNHELRPAGSALSQPMLATSAEAALPLTSAKADKFSSGFFSCDGQHLLLFSIPSPSRATMAQIRGWPKQPGLTTQFCRRSKSRIPLSSAELHGVAIGNPGDCLGRLGSQLLPGVSSERRPLSGDRKTVWRHDRGGGVFQRG
jgi:hypothetical protein